MRPFTIALAALAFSSAPVLAQAMSGPGGGSGNITGSGSETTGIPGSGAGDVSSGSSGSTHNDQSRVGDRRTLDDIKAGTSGSTQAR